MDSLNRVIKTIEFKNPDRFPVIHAVLPAAWMEHGDLLYSILKEYPRYLGSEIKTKRAGQASAGYEISSEYSEKYVLSDDFIFTEPRTYQYGKLCQKGYQSDEWSCIWRKEDPGIVGQVVGHPLQNYRKEIKNFIFPDANAAWRYDLCLLNELREQAEESKKYFLAYIGNLFELLQWLFGYENLLIMIHDESGEFIEFLERIAEYNIATMNNFCRFGINGVVLNDDWGTQQSLIINPFSWRKFFKPAYKKIIGHAKNSGLHFYFHTDGNTIEIIEDLIEIGVDVINPQLSAMDIGRLAGICRGKVCVKTDIDRQYILPFASAAEVGDYIKKIIELFGTRDGGLILCGELNRDIKLENVRAMYESFEKFGRIA